MALPVIGEDAKMQSHQLPDALTSPCASLARAPSLSPRSVSSTSSELLAPKKPQGSHNSRTTNPKLPWRYPIHPQSEDEDLIPIRRRFHSSDVVLRSNRAALAKLKSLYERDNDWRKKANAFSDNSDEENEPEPPLDSAELARLAVRRRTCSENFTKSSRAPSSYFQNENASFVGYDDGERSREKLTVEEEEHKTDEDDVDAVDHLLAELHDEFEAEAQPNDDFFDDSWSSQGFQTGRFSGGSIFSSGSNYSVESDGQNLEKLRNLQKLYQEGFITVTEYKDRRVQLVDELSEADRTFAKTSDLLSLELPIIYREPPDFSLLRARDAIKHVFDSEHRKWTSSRIKVKIDTEPFAKGGLRQVFHLQDLSIPPPTLRTAADDEDSVMSKCTSYVAKVAIDPNEDPDTYFKDVEMQAVAAKYAKLYNTYNPPRRVEFLEAWILQLIPADVSDAGDQTIESLTLSGTICGVEPFIAGEYHKHNNNFGYVSELERNTPQAFSHFTYEASGQHILVVDIQGVGDHYTDPQIHTRRGKEFGKGNLAVRGFERFLGSHRCNPICRYLKLPLINPKDEGSKPVDPKGTIPAQTYMSQPRVVVDQVDSVLCHYYGDSKVFKKYHKKKRGKKKRDKQHKSHCQEHRRKVQPENIVENQQAGDRFVNALGDQQRSCSSFVCDGLSQCIVS
ncbi:myosin heavy chain kinase, putative [Phytophthora infestans T30-4]|uniref:Myosin heavy chain kinase, putative n=1 Tax=Phytophthora infestans (strain T30-4) TaxID=403677 RepID=D0NEV8_PHYIT|nr:myosin heavy chain kinase, putative [Phytophthora infestans T30-4]EEY56747.1 myosin heavy chain kinase, putative [Phytophthora infestans T30-4]|eukprot:XP_002902075.1 myosin heavy chain kinase, putative [Phytophthora infestans T30-4]